VTLKVAAEKTGGSIRARIFGHLEAQGSVEKIPGENVLFSGLSGDSARASAPGPRRSPEMFQKVSPVRHGPSLLFGFVFIVPIRLRPGGVVPVEKFPGSSVYQRYPFPARFDLRNLYLMTRIAALKIGPVSFRSRKSEPTRRRILVF